MNTTELQHELLFQQVVVHLPTHRRLDLTPKDLHEHYNAPTLVRRQHSSIPPNSPPSRTVHSYSPLVTGLYVSRGGGSHGDESSRSSGPGEWTSSPSSTTISFRRRPFDVTPPTCPGQNQAPHEVIREIKHAKKKKIYLNKLQHPKDTNSSKGYGQIRQLCGTNR